MPRMAFGAFLLSPDRVNEIPAEGDQADHKDNDTPSCEEESSRIEKVGFIA